MIEHDIIWIYSNENGKEDFSMMKFNIQHYGALPNGALCTSQIQNAIDDCFLNGGGEVIIPEGVYLTGGLRLRSGVTLHLLENAVLSGSTSPEDYSPLPRTAAVPSRATASTCTCPPPSSASPSACATAPSTSWADPVIKH